MKRYVKSAVLGVCFIASLLPGCRRQELSGPPELRLGKVECGECGMLINEDRCSSALLIERDGERLHMCFDDIGCMLIYEAEQPGNKVIERYVHDYASRKWIAADGAVYLVGDKSALRTPMASGIVAFVDRAAAEEQMSRTGGEIKTYQQVVADAAK